MTHHWGNNFSPWVDLRVLVNNALWETNSDPFHLVHVPRFLRTYIMLPPTAITPSLHAWVCHIWIINISGPHVHLPWLGSCQTLLHFFPRLNSIQSGAYHLFLPPPCRLDSAITLIPASYISLNPNEFISAVSCWLSNKVPQWCCLRYTNAIRVDVGPDLLFHKATPVIWGLVSGRYIFGQQWLSPPLPFHLLLPCQMNLS